MHQTRPRLIKRATSSHLSAFFQRLSMTKIANVFGAVRQVQGQAILSGFSNKLSLITWNWPGQKPHIS